MPFSIFSVYVVKIRLDLFPFKDDDTKASHQFLLCPCDVVSGWVCLVNHKSVFIELVVALNLYQRLSVKPKIRKIPVCFPIVVQILKTYRFAFYLDAMFDTVDPER